MEGLSKKLEAKNIDFKVKQLIKVGVKVKALLLAYKDARVDMSILDEVAGVGNWQNDYKRDTKGVLQGGIAVKFGSEWVWKWSNGTESAMEKEKGEYSDAFKRAGFMWGIGRHLYDFPNLFIDLKDDEYYDKQGKPTASNKLRPNDWNWFIDYEKGIIGARDKKGDVRVNEKIK